MMMMVALVALKEMLVTLCPLRRSYTLCRVACNWRIEDVLRCTAVKSLVSSALGFPKVFMNT